MRTRFRQVLRMCFFLVVVMPGPVALAADTPISITTEQWARVDSPAEFVGIPGLKELVVGLDKDKRNVIEVHYAGGESGQLWAQQFRNRLVGLGVDSDRIELLQSSIELNVLQVKAGRL